MLAKCCHGLKLALKTEATKFYGEKQDFGLLTAETIEDCRRDIFTL